MVRYLGACTYYRDTGVGIFYSIERIVTLGGKIFLLQLKDKKFKNKKIGQKFF